jgi:serpin B
MRSSTLSALCLSAVFVAAGCANDGGAPKSRASAVAQSALSRNTSPNVPTSDADALVDGNRAFAVDLYKVLAKSDAFSGKNLFFSPHSISVALAMAYAGARGATASEMASALDFTLPPERLHNAMNGLDLDLGSRGATAKASDGSPFRLRVTNSLWGLPKMPFEQTFLDTIMTNYGAGVRLTDFAGDPEGSRTAINSWVAGETEQRIEELLAKGTITSNTRLVLVNAVYFNAAWQHAFEPAVTKSGSFHALGGDTSADFMHQTAELKHVRGVDYDAIMLPYDGDELDMIVVVPDSGALGSVEGELDASKLRTITSSMTSQNVDLTLPKFKIEGVSFSLKVALAALGMKQAFEPDHADFSGILSPSVDRLYVSDVVHEAFVSVDEKGTEAAAATAVVAAGFAAAPVEAIAVTVDRPFLFGVRDRATGAFVFFGRVVNP